MSIRSQETSRRSGNVANFVPPALQLDHSQLDGMRNLVPLTPSPMRPKVQIVSLDDDLDTNQFLNGFDSRDEAENSVSSADMDMDTTLEMELGTESPANLKSQKSMSTLIQNTSRHDSRLSGISESFMKKSINLPWFVNDFLTPYKLCILILIVRYWSNWQKMEVTCKISLGRQLIKWIYERDDPVDPPLDELLPDAQLCLDKDYTNLANYLMIQVYRLNELDSIYVFFEEIKDLLYLDSSSKLVLSPFSVLGIFVHKCHLSFESMTFEKSDAFHEAFKAYCESAWKDPKRALDMSDLSYQSPIRCSMVTRISSVATHTLESVLDKIVKSIEDRDSIPLKVRSKLSELSELFPEYYQFDYIAYMEAIQNKDYMKVISCFHRFLNSVICGEKTIKSVLPYALLHFADTLLTFKKFEPARDIIDESIRVARFADDLECLNLALSMLYQLYVKEGNSETNIHLLIAEHESSLKEMESLKISHLLASAYLLQAQEIINNSRANVNTLLNSITKATAHIVTKGRAADWTLLNSVLGGIWFKLGSNLLSAIYAIGNEFPILLDKKTALQINTTSFLNLALMAAEDSEFNEAENFLNLAKESSFSDSQKLEEWTQVNALVAIQKNFYSSPASVTSEQENLLWGYIDLFSKDLAYGNTTKLLLVDLKIHQKAFNKAAEILSKSLDPNKQSNAVMQVYILVRLARICNLTREGILAKNYLEKAQNLCLGIQQHSLLCHVFLEYIQWLINHRLFEKSRVYLEKFLPQIASRMSQFHYKKACDLMLSIQS